MKIVLILCAVVGVAVGEFKCYKGADAAAAASVACPQVTDPNDASAKIDETKCSGPKIVNYAVSAAAYACGAGDADTALTCDTAECNKPVTDNVEWKCDTYTWDATVDPAGPKKGLEAAQKTCVGVKDITDDDKKCSIPGESAVVTTVPLPGGCGPCAAAAVTAKTCETINSAAAITAFLLPMIALFYTLF